MSVVMFRLRPFYLRGKNRRYPLGHWVGIRSDLDTVGKTNVRWPSWESNSDSWVAQSIASRHTH
jgi:hypothetical protein